MEKAPRKEGGQMEIDFNNIQENISPLHGLLVEIFELCHKTGENYLARTSKIAHKLMEKYPDCRDYTYFHELIGSTVKKDQYVKEDFPGEDSIQIQLSKLLEELHNNDLIMKEKKEIVELLSGTYPDYFRETNLVREGSDWCVMRLGKCLKIPEWIKETEEDINYHSSGGNNYWWNK